MRRIAAVVILLAAAIPAIAGSSFSIHETCERFGNTTAYNLDGNTSQTRISAMSITAVIYRFEIRAAAAAPEKASAEWVVLTKEGTRRPQECARGTAELDFPKKKRRATVDTGRIQLPGRPDDARNSTPSLYGYGIRLTDATGRVLAEKYSPPGARNAITWQTVATTTDSAPTRKTVPMPVVF